MYSTPLIYCVPEKNTCLTTTCFRHISKAPTGIIIPWANYWLSCSSKTQAAIPIKPKRTTRACPTNVTLMDYHE